jgi:hypothetical protein
MSASQNSASPNVSTPKSWKPKNANCNQVSQNNIPIRQKPKLR